MHPRPLCLVLNVFILSCIIIVCQLVQIYIILTYREIIIIIICRNRHSFKRGWIPHKRETLMVCNLHFPTGTTYFIIFGIEGHFRRENPTSFLVG